MRRLVFAALAAFLLAVAPADAVSTTTLALTTSWQDLGAGPLQVQTNNQSQTIFQIADTAPGATAGGFFLQGNSVPQVVSTTSHVWARVRLPAAAVLIYAPVTVATSSGGGGGGGSSAITSPVGANTKAQSVSTTFATDQLLPAFAATPTFNLGSGSVGNTGFAAYGPTPEGTAPAQPPLYNGYKDGAGLTRGVSPATPLPALPYDVRATTTLTATAGQVVNIPLNGTASVGLTVSGVTSAAATLAFNTSNDGGTTYLAKGAINCSAPGNNPTTIVADGQTRFDVSGATNLQVKATAGNGGSVTVAYNLSAAPVACPNVPSVAIPTSAAGAHSGVTVGTTSAPAAAAQSRRYLVLDNESATATIACALGATAAINAAGSFTIPPGQTRTWSGTFVPADAVNCVASAASTPLTLGQN